MKFRHILGGFAALAAACLTMQSAAAAFPERPIRLIIPFPPGGSTDLVGRMLAKGMSDRLGQPVVVENVAGAGGAIGVQQMARAVPDGYTLAFTVNGPITLIPVLNKAVRYKVEDLEPLGIAYTSPWFLVVPSSSPWKDFGDLVAAGKPVQKNDYNFGSSGVGAFSHIAGEMVNISTGTKFQHIPYKGAQETLRAMVTGEVQWGLLIGIDAMGPLADGRLRALVTLDNKRSPMFPDVPTMEEKGFKSTRLMVWTGLFAPKKIPEATRDLLNRTLREVLSDPVVAKRIEDLGANVRVRNNTPKAIKPELEAETDAFDKTARALNVKLD